MLRPSFLLLSIVLLACSGPKKPAMTKAASVPSFTSDTLHRISSQFVFTEGPAVDRDGTIFFTDQPRNQIWKYATDGSLSLFMDNAGRANGLYIDRAGNIVACADEHNELWSITAAGQKTVLLKAPSGKAFNGPNDLWIDSHGGIYFTDPYYQRDYWTRKAPELDFQGLYYLAAGASAAVLLDSSMNKPNGIVGSPDGKWLYVADIGAGKTYRYDIDGAGAVSHRTLFVEQGSDGMTLDSEGNLYISGKGVTAFDPSGKQVFHLPVPSNWTGNLCFGGKQRDQLFITASESVYVIRMNRKGVQ
ncbi:MAG: SMP-30/gluconolactonase/LRE family protein [Chitinophagaceae bacterium]|nr:MAG: SMP-30/gluconolactonase/LRE family protein [Chitinophagaceae bacterium]